MTARDRQSLLAVPTAVVALILILVPRPTQAQTRPAPVAEFAAGELLFADDGVVREGSLGGSARFYILPRVSVGSELAYVRGDNHSHLVLTANVTFDVVRGLKGEPRPVTPFLVVGGTCFEHANRFRATKSLRPARARGSY